jgi:ribosomal protein L37E
MDAQGGEFLSRFSMADYQAAINAAPPNTMIKLGDLDKALVTCSTCGARMEPAATAFHKHPKDCDTCGLTYDENMEKHTPMITTSPHGNAGTVVYSSGCKVEAL